MMPPFVEAKNVMQQQTFQELSRRIRGVLDDHNIPSYLVSYLDVDPEPVIHVTGILPEAARRAVRGLAGLPVPITFTGERDCLRTIRPDDKAVQEYRLRRDALLAALSPCDWYTVNLLQSEGPILIVTTPPALSNRNIEDIIRNIFQQTTIKLWFKTELDAVEGRGFDFADDRKNTTFPGQILQQHTLLQPGISIGPSSEAFQAGTAGPVLTDGINCYIMSCGHALCHGCCAEVGTSSACRPCSTT